jgi:fatty acid desaturase
VDWYATESADERVTLLSRPQTFRWLGAALFDWGLIALAMAGAYFALQYAQASRFSPPSGILFIFVCGLAIMVIGNRQHAIAILGHDGGHGLASSTRWVNDLLTEVFCFWPLNVGLGGYRAFHFKHHKTFGSAEDPELPHKRANAPRYDLPKTPREIFTYFWKDSIGLGIKEDLMLFELISGREGPLDVIGPIFWWGITLALLWTYGLWWLLILWFLALGSFFWATFRLRIWTEHMGTPDVHRISATWWQRALFVPHNTWYHFEHHRATTIPFWNLPKARGLNKEDSIKTIEELFESYATMPHIPSGTPLR